MAETLGPVVAVDAGVFSAGIEGLGLLPPGAEQAGPMVGDAVGPARLVGMAGLAGAEGGDDIAVDSGRRVFETGTLVQALYAEIRTLAASQLADQWAANSLHPTALADEAVPPPGDGSRAGDA